MTRLNRVILLCGLLKVNSDTMPQDKTEQNLTAVIIMKSSSEAFYISIMYIHCSDVIKWNTMNAQNHMKGLNVTLAHI